MRADRLLTILTMLQSHGRLTSRELAIRLEVSERTIHRDMESLAVAGIPLYAQRGAKGGWALSEGYRNRLTGLTSDEISSLLLLQSSAVVKDLGLLGNMSSALRKLHAALPPAVRHDADFARERIHVDGAGWHAPPGPQATGQPLLALVQEAVWVQRKLLIAYRSHEADGPKQRLISPLGLVAKSNVWYVMAMAEASEGETDGAAEIRTYRISRFAEAQLTDETFARPEGFDLAAAWEASVQRFKTNLPRYPAQVAIHPAAWARFCAERYVTVRDSGQAAGGESIGRGSAGGGANSRDNEWIRAEVSFHTLESACSILLGYGGKARALAPEELRQAVLAEAKALVGLHETQQ